MYRDVEEMLTRELREVADHVMVPPLPELPTAPPRARFAWQPMLVAAALVLVALATVASLLQMDGGQSPQPAPQPTDVVTDDATDAVPDAVPTGPPTVPYLLDGVVHVDGGRFSEGFASLAGTDAGWLAQNADSRRWRWSNGAVVQDVTADVIPQAPAISPNGEYIAWINAQGQMNGFQTDPAGEGMGIPAEVPETDEDGVPTRIGAVTDDGWVIASGRGVSLLWRPYVDGGTIDLTETAPDQQVLQSTGAGLVVLDATSGARDAASGRVYLADLTGRGEIAPIAELPNFGLLDAAGDWIAWASADVVGGDALTYDELRVRRVDGGDEGVLTPPDGWQFVNGESGVVFEDDRYLLARVTDGDRERMMRCSPALVECVLLDTPSADR